MTLVKWNIEEMTGYKPKTTFWQDFSIADMFGASAVEDTYKRAFDEWKDDYNYLTELVLVLNHKIWQHYRVNGELAEIYNDLWLKTEDYALSNLTDDELNYYYSVID